jgi:hypothetical protein
LRPTLAGACRPENAATSTQELECNGEVSTKSRGWSRFSFATESSDLFKVNTARQWSMPGRHPVIPPRCCLSDALTPPFCHRCRFISASPLRQSPAGHMRAGDSSGLRELWMALPMRTPRLNEATYPRANRPAESSRPCSPAHAHIITSCRTVVSPAMMPTRSGRRGARARARDPGRRLTPQCVPGLCSIIDQNSDR